MMELLREKFQDSDTVRYQDLAETHRRRVVAGAFFEILTLKTWGRVDVQQQRPYADIFITAAEGFDQEIPSA
jgi:chromatin segregation and condensation protein Rec8/ScpA/Scc1 (kleisin family)